MRTPNPLLLLIGAIATALLLSACFGASGAASAIPAPTPATTELPTTQPSPTATPTPAPTATPPPQITYTIVDTAQNKCFTATDSIRCPASHEPFFGQDAQYQGAPPIYRRNGDGTVTDPNTGLMWQRDPGDKMTLAQALAGAEASQLGGYDDWRLPTIKQLYSLIDFRGITGRSAPGSTPYLDTLYFAFEYGDTDADERFIDAQFASSTRYVSTTMNGDETVFGVNFADGRIKGYPVLNQRQGTETKFFIRYVRGNTDYGVNNFVDNNDGTITDFATGLIWSKTDSAQGMDWEAALASVQQQNQQNYLGHNDWRLPNAKELHSILDYSRSPATTSSAAIDPLFETTVILDEAGRNAYPFYWTSTSHLDGPNPGDHAVYLAFGQALGYMENPPNSGSYKLLDVHGAGAQRSDPKVGDPKAYPLGHGPQGDVIRILNYVRLVRGGSAIPLR